MWILDHEKGKTRHEMLDDMWDESATPVAFSRYIKRDDA